MVNWAQVFMPLAVAFVVLAVAVVGFSRDPLGRVITAVGDAVVARLRPRTDGDGAGDGFAAGLEVGAKLYRFFRRLTGCEYIGRALIFTCKVNGPDLQTGRPQRVRLVIGWHERETGDAVEHPDPETLYEDVFQVDEHYIGLLVRLLGEKIIEVVTADMPPGVLIGSLYRREGVVYAQWFLLEVDRVGNTITYASVASYKRKFTPDEADNLRIQMERIKSIYRYGNDPGTAFDMPSLQLPRGPQ